MVRRRVGSSGRVSAPRGRSTPTLPRALGRVRRRDAPRGRLAVPSRAEIVPVGPDFAITFKRTTPAFQRAANVTSNGARAAEIGSSRPAGTSRARPRFPRRRTRSAPSPPHGVREACLFKARGDRRVFREGRPDEKRPARTVLFARRYGRCAQILADVFDALRALDVPVFWTADDWCAFPDDEFVGRAGRQSCLCVWALLRPSRWTDGRMPALPKPSQNGRSYGRGRADPRFEPAAFFI